MVASVVEVVMEFLQRVLVEAHADALARVGSGSDLMAQPAFEQHEMSGLRRDGDPRFVRRARPRLARGCGHEALEPRILELQTRRAERSLQVISAAQGREGMQVCWMRGA